MPINLPRRLETGLGHIFGAPYYRWQVTRELAKRGGPPMLVWQMGKVGSSTVYASLRHACPDAPLFHVHMLTEEMLRKGEYFQKQQLKGNEGFEYNRCLRSALLESFEAGTRWKIVSVVREPVGRNLSAFFQNLELYFPEDRIRGPALDALPARELIDAFLQKFDHDRPMEWFDGEIKGLLGLDVFSEPFPREAGFRTWERDGFDMLLLRMESLNAVAKQALAAFLDMPGFELVNRNIGAEKAYANKYRSVKEQIVFPRDYLDRCYGSRYATHFYTPEEIARFRQRWSET